MVGLRNYTTSIAVEKTIMEIEKILTSHGANRILKDYDGAGNVTGLNFTAETEFGTIPFKLPMDAQRVSQVLQNHRAAGKISLPLSKATDINHARRVGWRIIKDWIHSQMSLLELELVKIEEIFLPYAWDFKSDSTLYEKLRKQQFAGFLEGS